MPTTNCSAAIAGDRWFKGLRLLREKSQVSRAKFDLTKVELDQVRLVHFHLYVSSLQTRPLNLAGLCDQGERNKSEVTTYTVAIPRVPFYHAVSSSMFLPSVSCSNFY